MSKMEFGNRDPKEILDSLRKSQTLETTEKQTPPVINQIQAETKQTTNTISQKEESEEKLRSRYQYEI